MNEPNHHTAENDARWHPCIGCGNVIPIGVEWCGGCDDPRVTPHYQDATVTLYAGDCLDVLRELPDASVDAVCTDPPYGLEFMGKDWDKFDSSGANKAKFRKPSERDHERGAEQDGMTVRMRSVPEAYVAGSAFQDWCGLWAAECLRVLKPGAHMVAFGGTRTWHRLACAVEDAGFEIRDSLAYLFGSGFPKSLNVGKAIDRTFCPNHVDSRDHTCPPAPEAEAWRGHGTALKPGFEPVVVARKPLVGTVAATVTAYGTGALNIDGCRVGTDENLQRLQSKTAMFADEARPWKDRIDPDNRQLLGSTAGRWPANVVLDETQARELDQQSGELTSGANPTRRGADGDRTAYGDFAGQEDANPQRGTDVGGASRFYYTAKANSSERVRVDGIAHPTVKPLDLMRWLIRLITPPGGVVLEPFAGSGTTVEAAILEGFPCIAIERETDYLPLITQRINRRRDPIAAIRATGDDGGLFDLLDEEESA